MNKVLKVLNDAKAEVEAEIAEKNKVKEGLEYRYQQINIGLDQLTTDLNHLNIAIEKVETALGK